MEEEDESFQDPDVVQCVCGNWFQPWFIESNLCEDCLDAAEQKSVQPTVSQAGAQAQPDKNPSELGRPPSGG